MANLLEFPNRIFSSCLGSEESYNEWKAKVLALGSKIKLELMDGLQGELKKFDAQNIVLPDRPLQSQGSTAKIRTNSAQASSKILEPLGGVPYEEPGVFSCDFSLILDVALESLQVAPVATADGPDGSAWNTDEPPAKHAKPEAVHLNFFTQSLPVLRPSGWSGNGHTCESCSENCRDSVSGCRAEAREGRLELGVIPKLLNTHSLAAQCHTPLVMQNVMQCNCFWGLRSLTPFFDRVCAESVQRQWLFFCGLLFGRVAMRISSQIDE